MKKVKITVLKTTLDKELAAEYGVEGLTACPMMREGQVFSRTTRNQKVCVMRHGRRFISMYLPWPMAREASCFIMETGFASLGLRSAAATTAFVQ